MTATKRFFKHITAAVHSAASSFASLFSRNNERKCQKQFIRHLQFLITDIFSCLVSDEYLASLYHFERRIHKEKMNCFTWLTRLQKFRDTEREAKCLTLVIDAGQIRRRVIDHTTFALCRTELLELESVLLKFAADFMHEDLAEILSHLTRCIDQIDDSFHHVLKVASREPIVFMLFLGTLREFQSLAILERAND